MATASETNETISQILKSEIVRLSNSSSFTMLRHFHLVMLSPISLTFVLTIARAEAQSEQLKRRLMDITKFDYVDEKALHDEMLVLRTQLNTENLPSNLSLHNCIFYRKPKNDKNLNCDYVDQKIVENIHNEVNQWIAEKSRGILTRFNFNTCTDFLIANCVYFSGEWELDLTNNCKPVYHLILRNYICEYLRCTFVELKFKGDRFSMIFIYPFNFKAYHRIFREVNSNLFNDILEHLKPSYTQLILPQGVFQLNIRFDHLMSLQNLNYVFETKSANQKLYFNITDKGTEAVAVTTCNLSNPELTNYVMNDDVAKIVFVLYDTLHKVILFVGQT